MESLAVAALALTGQDGAIPEVGSHKSVFVLTGEELAELKSILDTLEVEVE